MRELSGLWIEAFAVYACWMLRCTADLPMRTVGTFFDWMDMVRMGAAAFRERATFPMSPRESLILAAFSLSTIAMLLGTLLALPVCVLCDWHSDATDDLLDKRKRLDARALNV